MEPSSSRKTAEPESAADPGEARRGRWNRRASRLGRAIALLATFALVVEVGFPVARVERLFVLFLVGLGPVGFGMSLAAEAWRERRGFARGRAIDLLALAVFLADLVWRAAGEPPEWMPSRALVQGSVVAVLAIAACVRLAGRLSALGIRPPLLLAASFGTLVLLGSLALLMPRSHAPGRTLSVVEALFTATSAVCVTGLTVVDLGRDLSPLGQGIVLALIQLGGLGLVTFALLFTAMRRGGMEVREMVAVRDILSARWVGEAGPLLFTVILVTVVFEGAGALFLYLFVPEPSGTTSRVWFATFHSVSAFCNAGLALPGENLTGYERSPQVLAGIVLLFVCGGIGFATILDVGRWARGLCARALRSLGSRRSERHRLARLPLHARLALGTSAVLLLAGGLLLWFLNWNAPDRGFRGGGGLPLAFFHAASARTAGFNAGSVEGMSEGAHWLLVALMVVGGSPGSTAGGLKTVTAAVLVAAIVAFLRGRDAVEVGRRRLPWRIVTAAIAVSALYAAAAFAVTLTLLLTEPEIPLRASLFESVSALGTVGLSLGITPDLSVAGRLVICVAMFVGRIGPLTLVTLMAGERRGGTYEYPEEPVAIG